MPNRVHLKGPFRLEEADAGGTISPSHLIKRDSSGDFVVHSVAGDPAEAIFAQEDALQGKTLADDYVSGDKVQAIVAAKGSEIFAFLKGGVDAADGIFLSSAGDGTLELVGAGDANIAVAVEALDLGALPAARIKVRVL